MAKATNILGLGLGAAIVYGIYAKWNNVKNAIPKISVSNPTISAKPSIKALSIVLDITIDVNNPGSSDIPFDYYTGTVLYAGGKIADFNFNNNGKIVNLKARSKTPLAFQISIANLTVAYKIIKLLKAVSQNLPVDTKLEVRSSFYAAGIDVPVNYVYDIKTLSVGRVNFFRKKIAPPPPVVIVNDEIETEAVTEPNVEGYEY